ALFHHDGLATDDVGGGMWIVGELVDDGCVEAQLGGALYAAVGISEIGFRTETGAGGHAPAKSHGDSISAMRRGSTPPPGYSAPWPGARGYMVSRSSGRCHCVPRTPCLAA